MTSVDVLIATFRRAHLFETMQSVAAQADAGLDLRIIVADNDEEPRRRRNVLKTGRDLGVPVTYLHAPARNISVARNACLDAATAHWVAFIDDDELAEPGWLRALLARAAETGSDAVFGPSEAVYPDPAPPWVRRLDLHSNRPEIRGGEVETGHTCNALLRWAGRRWEGERFDIRLGRSGGEDTEFFFRLRRMGAVFAVADNAVVREEVEPARMTLGWLATRRFRMGQSYAVAARGPAARLALLCRAGGKAAYCVGRAGLELGDPVERRFWWLRGVLHAGVCAGILMLRKPQIYGERA